MEWGKGGRGGDASAVRENHGTSSAPSGGCSAPPEQRRAEDTRLSVRLSQFIDRLDSQIPNWYESDGKRTQRPPPPKTLFFLLKNFTPIYATQLEAVCLVFCRQRKRGSLRLGDNPVAIVHKCVGWTVKGGKHCNINQVTLSHS